MANNFTDAISAYRTAARTLQGNTASKDSDSPGSGPSFSDMVKSSVQDTISVNKKAEQLQVKAITGQADLRDVVTAVSSAQLTLETVVAIRDKVVSAYNDILKMPI
ncbi:MAG: flagellar hook-basal body complex protein FliE [Alphaproteobacteria bacterium]|nr:flagellar hook-basal body complex protein FliE [Alphaproteobacteria bacterium]